MISLYQLRRYHDTHDAITQALQEFKAKSVQKVLKRYQVLLELAFDTQGWRGLTEVMADANTYILDDLYGR